MEILVSGSGNIHAFDLKAVNSEVTISGSGTAYLDARDHLKVNISGSGNVYYQGTPEVDSHISGSGVVRKYR
jgi:hypothetical protein